MSIILDILIDILFSMLSAFVFWLLTFVVTGTKVVFSNAIEKSPAEKAEDGTPIYRIRLMNIGHRDLTEVAYTAKLRIHDGQRIRTTYLCAGEEQTVPILIGKNKSLPNQYRTYLAGLYVRDAARNEFLKSCYPRAIQSKAQEGVLVLEDLLQEYGSNIDITVFATGNDRLTGARKTFISKEYTAKDIVEGRFTKWNGLPRGIKSFFHKTQVATEIISQIDTIEDVLQRTYIDVTDILNNTNSSAKDAFLRTAELRKPENEYRGIKIDEIEEKIAALNRFLQGVELDPTSPKTLQAAIMLLERNLLALNYVKANYDYLHCAKTDKEMVTLRHMDYNSQLYGLPKKEVFDAILQTIGEKGNDKRNI